MLGCKSITLEKKSLNFSELIDTCWDVNIYITQIWQDKNYELIDTCWDVNIYITQIWQDKNYELIDTCWDVNFIKWKCW